MIAGVFRLQSQVRCLIYVAREITKMAFNSNAITITNNYSKLLKRHHMKATCIAFAFSCLEWYQRAKCRWLPRTLPTFKHYFIVLLHILIKKIKALFEIYKMVIIFVFESKEIFVTRIIFRQQAIGPLSTSRSSFKYHGVILCESVTVHSSFVMLWSISTKLPEDN